MPVWTNADGLKVKFALDNGATEAESGVTQMDTHTLEVVLDSADLPAAADAAEDIAHLPANAVITDAFLVCNTAWAGTSPTLTIGLVQSDGSTVIDADGIDAAIDADGVQAAAGDMVACDGALVDKTATIGGNRGWVYATTGGTVTAGKSTLYLRYFVPSTV